MLRKPAVAGQFYPGSVSELRALLKKMVDVNAEKSDAIGLVSPHAGYIYSGPIAGATVSRARLRDTFVIIGPNHTGIGKPFAIMTEGTWRTPLGDVEIDSELGKKLLFSGRLQEDPLAHQYEHSIEVQLPFLQYLKPDIKIVPIVMAPTDVEVCQEIGRAIAAAAKSIGREIIVLASSDMTHYESAESARKKDTRALAAVLEMNEDALLDNVDKFRITMCGAVPVAVMMVAAKALGATATELVGYRNSGDTTGDYASVVGYAGVILKAMSPQVRLARDTVESYVREGKVVRPESISPDMKQRAGVFVSVHKLGQLRGCIGTIEPQRPNVAEEIITNAVSAATRDPRFPPVAPEELKDLDYSVDVLTSPEPVEDRADLDPKKYGAIVQCGWRRGLLLPDLEGVDTVDQQLDICCQKAGIYPGELLKLYRFEVKRYR